MVYSVLLAIAIVIVTVSRCECSVPDPDGILGLKWRDSLDTVQKKAGSAKWTLLEQTPPPDQSLKYEGQCFGQLAWIVPHFINNELYLIVLAFNSMNSLESIFADLMRILTEKYGTAGVLEGAFHDYRWNTENVEIRLFYIKTGEFGSASSLYLTYSYESIMTHVHAEAEKDRMIREQERLDSMKNEL